MTTRDIDKEKLERLITQLEINTDNIYHIILSGDIEMIGELFPPDQIEISNDDEDSDELELILDPEFENELTRDDPNDIIFLNPIKILRDSWIDENGNFISHTFFVEWNSCIDGPYTHINKNKITSINTPNAETLLQYLKAVYNQYYPLLEEIQKSGNILGEKINLESIHTQNESIKKSPTNVVSFSPYKKKRDSGTF